jgi:tetratricopeptide (TPR) repeat protein
VCEPCVDLLQLQEAFGWGVYDTGNLAVEGRYDEILAWLDAFEKANRHRDHDGWLARSIASHRELTLWEAERYEEALVACDVVEQLGFEDAWYQYAAGSAKACVLEGLERHEEALAVFEEALRHHDLSHIETTRHLMHRLTEYSNRAGKPVDESWREVVQNVADEFEVEMPMRDSLAETILALYELTENKPSKRQRAAQQRQND